MFQRGSVARIVQECLYCVAVIPIKSEGSPYPYESATILNNGPDFWMGQSLADIELFKSELFRLPQSPRHKHGTKNDETNDACFPGHGNRFFKCKPFYHFLSVFLKCIKPQIFILDCRGIYKIIKRNAIHITLISSEVDAPFFIPSPFLGSAIEKPYLRIKLKYLTKRVSKSLLEWLKKYSEDKNSRITLHVVGIQVVPVDCELRMAHSLRCLDEAKL